MNPTAVIDVAKKVGRPRKPVAADESPSRKPMVMQVRGSNEFKAWFDRLAQFDGLTPTALFDRAVRRYAKEIGFTEDAPKR